MDTVKRVEFEKCRLHVPANLPDPAAKDGEHSLWRKSIWTWSWSFSLTWQYVTTCDHMIPVLIDFYSTIPVVVLIVIVDCVTLIGMRIKYETLCQNALLVHKKLYFPCWTALPKQVKRVLHYHISEGSVSHVGWAIVADFNEKLDREERLKAPHWDPWSRME
ncbi:hypothetical protein KIN20_024639 [Parelaphostrongylus tenuis]|uniref:Uncharacterized protein n=1 Tax=Parelaphostrongylus tenuis TaxID=148309 RepID=A0AAD5MYI4_PARTN|nr:hypothetical protein KIN20_024639 [Parelaphostrongylus tenuis]